MDGFRSKSSADGRMQIVAYGGGERPDFRSYSYSSAVDSYEYQYVYGGGGGGGGERGAEEVKKSKSTKRWPLVGGRDMERKKRVAAYKAVSMEGKVKGSVRRSFKWLKERYMQVVHGWS